MKKTFLIILLIAANTVCLAQVAIDSNWSEDVKSVYLNSLSNEQDPPYIRMGQFGEPTQQLLLRFDILSPQPEHLRYRIHHCDAEWHSDDLEDSEFFSGPVDGSINTYQSSFTTLIEYTNYYQPIPEESGYFMASGNYLLEVYPADNPDSIILTRRFYVFEELVDIDMEPNKPSGAYGNINRDQEVDIRITPRRGSYLPLHGEYYHVVLQQNRREDLKRNLGPCVYSGSSMEYKWQAANVFPGGNHFRYFDLSNLWAAMYHVQRIEQWGGENFAFLQPEEDRSRKVYTQYNSLNGGMKTNIRERRNPHIEADYVWVNFSLPMERPFLNGSVHIIGDLTLGRLNDESRMEWNAQYKAYTKRLLLKQGYYSYQLLFLPAGNQSEKGEALTATLEGDHFVMPNNYTAYIYYRSPGSRYDRLVGLRSIVFNY